MKKQQYNLRLDELIDSEAMLAKMSSIIDNQNGASSGRSDAPRDGNKPQVRKAVLELLKESYKTARNKCERWLFEDGDGNLCSRRISAYQDQLIILIYKFAVAHVFQINNPSSAEQMAVTAVGGYGRGTLAPGSDIDLLFILPYKQTPWGESVVEYILYMLWDMGFKVGQATRTIDECLRLAREDFTICTSVLEVRFIWGEKQLHDELIERFINEVMKGTAQDFIAAKMKERDLRHEKTGRSRYLVEPNIKDGKGGLRDLHTLFWIAKYYYRVATRRELIKLGVFTRAEYNRFKKAQNFLWTVRCHMHFLTGRAEDRLNFELQREMAARLGYTSHPGLSAVERFMKHYFLVAKDVGDLTLILCSKLEEEELITHSGISQIVNRIKLRSRKIKGSKDFVEQNGRINVASDDVFEKDPTNLIRVFKIAHDHNFHYHPDLLRLINRSFKLINAKLRKDKKANKLFIKILTSHKDPESTLRKMNESGVLGRFIPAFGKVIAMMQFNMYHHYTVDEHLLRSIGILHEIEQGELEDQHPLANTLMPNISDRTVLYVALFLHDIAKGRPQDHSIEGAKIARRICPRLGLSKEQTELVAWLIEEHLTMSNISQSRDLADRKTITDFANIVQTMERMRLLLILTICDIKAVGEGVWNGWKGQLLRTLYYETEPLLTGGFSQMSRKERVAMAKRELLEALSDWPREEAEYWVDLQYSAYLLTVDTEDQVRHITFMRDATAAEKKLALGVDTKKFQAITELMVMAQDHPKLLSIIAGACTAAGANIADAKIYTTRDGRAFNIIFINRIFEKGSDERRRAATIEKLIEGVLKGETKLPDIIAQKAKSNRKTDAFSITPVVSIDNTLSEKFTVIELEGLDRPGLLSLITHALSGLFLDIASAHIATFGEKVVDSFYVTDLTGAKITSVERQKTIQKALIKLLKTNNRKGSKAA